MQQLQRHTVLIVDDQATARSLLKRMLVIHGYDVLEAESGECALELAFARDIHGVVLDLKMPGIGGIETCRRLRAMPAHRVTPILIVTALDEHESLAQAFEAGCDDYIPKPIESVVLQTRLNGHLQRAGLYYQLERVRRLRICLRP